MSNTAKLEIPSTGDDGKTPVYNEGTDSWELVDALTVPITVANGGTEATTASGARTNLGLGSIATQASSSVTITGGSVTGITDLAVADGGTGASTAANARTNLGLVIGTDVQAQDAELAAIAGLTSAADRLPYFTGSGTASLATFTAAGRALVDDADAAAQLTTLGISAFVQTILDDANAAAVRATIGAVIGTNVQAWDADLDALAAISGVQGDIIYHNGTSWARLAAGTNGHFLKTQGAGANPQWAAASGSGAVATDAIFDAKGDLPVGTGADTASKLTVGSDGQVLTADAAQATGVKWATPSAGSFTFDDSQAWLAAQVWS